MMLPMVVCPYAQVKQAVLSWVRNTNTEQQMVPFIRNKAAQVAVAMVQVHNTVH